MHIVNLQNNPWHTRQSCCHKPGRRRAPRGRTCRAMAQGEVPAVPLENLTKEDLVNYLRSGCKPRDRWKFGTEHEKLGYYVSSLKRLEYSAIRQLLEGLVSRYSWAPIMEGTYIIGAEKDGQSVTIEPGGQFELSGAPLASLHDTDAETHSHLDQVKSIAKEVGVAFLTLGFDPKWQVADVPIMPKNRYRIMRAYMARTGRLGHDMMFRSCTIQTNIDFEDEADMVEKMRIGVALQPIATALFANSPFRGGKPSGYKSWRSQVWTDVDGDRTGILPFIWEPNYGFERYTEYALDVPMYFRYDNGEYLDATAKRTTFREFMDGKLPSAPGARPLLKDWEMHLTTIFPEVRLKRYMEMRGGDGGPPHMIAALPAFWVGLLYDREAQSACYSMIKDWTTEEHQGLRRQVPKDALQTPFRSTTVQGIAVELLKLARQGLSRRGLGEERFLQPLDEIASSGKTLADQLLEQYQQQWHGDIDRAYSPELTY